MSLDGYVSLPRPSLSKVCTWSNKRLKEIASSRDLRVHTCSSSLADDKKVQASGESWARSSGVPSGPSSLVAVGL